jgi:CRP-like cAMP-binding protein
MNLVLDNNTALITFRKAAIFSSFTDDELNAGANHTFHFSLRREEYIFKYGDMPYYLYIVSSGVLKSVKYPSREKQSAFFLRSGML